MNHKSKYLVLSLTALIFVALAVAALTATSVRAATAYYVDCSAATNGNGSQSSPWNTLTSVNGKTFVAGDQVLFKRGVTCSGVLWPKGSGASGSPITIADYNTGALPIINGGLNEEAIKLYNQQYWAINNIETTGGTRYGIYVNGDGSAVLHYFHITNTLVHDVTGGTMDMKSTGLIVFGYNWNQQFDDILIENVTAHDTTLWAGIIVTGKGYNRQSTRSNNVTIRNTTVYNIYGDGIITFSATNVLMEYNVAHNTGIQPGPQTLGTPSGIWEWDCNTCVVQYNEGYLNCSLANDGGSFDIDYYNDNNTVQYNYGHDNQGYGVSIFGAETSTTTNSVVRYNIFAYNDRKSGYSAGDIVLSTWNNGSLDGIQIYNNTMYWNPTDSTAAAITSVVTFTGSLPRFAKNNLIYSSVPGMINVSNNGLSLDYNLYWHTGGAPKWTYNGQNYTSFSSYKSGSGQDAHGVYADPLLNNPTYHSVGRPTTQFMLLAGSPAINAGTNVGNMGTRDFFGNAIPAGGAYDIGAAEYGGAPPPATNTPTNTPVPPTNTPGGPTNTPTNTPVNTPTPTNTPGSGATLFSDNFEDGSVSDWTISGNAQISSSSCYEGSYCASAKQQGSFAHTISTVGKTNIHFKYAGRTMSMTTGESLKVEWYDGTTWYVVDNLLSSTWLQRDWTLPAGAANNPNFAIRFTANATKNTKWGFADIVQVTGQ